MYMISLSPSVKADEEARAREWRVAMEVHHTTHVAVAAFTSLNS